MRLTLRTTINVVPRVSPMMAETLRMISWDGPTEGQSSDDAESSDEDDPEILKLVRQRVYYPPPKTITRTMQLTSRKIQRTKAMILGETLVQISRMVDSLEPPQTLYEGITPLLASYRDKKHYCDVIELPRSLLTSAKEVRLLRLGAEASSLEPPGRFEAEKDRLGIKIATKEVPWQDVCDGITSEGHVAIREEDAQMMATVFSWRSDHSFISAPPPDLAKQAHTKHIDVQIWDQLFELCLPQYVPDEIHRVMVDILTEYREAISASDTDIGLSLVIQHEIQTGNHSPIHCKPYRYSLIERKKALERIREFEASGWIEPATQPWSFPVVLVPKKNGAIRICIDYRKLNEITIKNVYPLPRIDDLLDAIGCANYFSTFDIRHGFHHILVREEDRPKTAFVLFEGTWQWVRCLMGICNAPATFQRAMNMTFQNFVNKTRLTQGMINFCVIVYMDDILVYSETYHGHAQHIEWTLSALRDAGFKIALKKSEFFLSEISFLGYVVTRGGLRPDLRKVAAVREAPVPTSLTQVRAFLGLASSYRRFIKGFAAIARPLRNMLRKDQSLSWDAECQQAFATLKDALATTPILIRPDPSKQFILITDWQPEGISAIFAQKGNDDREHVIEYASRTVPDERRNDSAPQGECYAVVWGIQHFHPYLYGQKFRLVMDHEPLLALKKLTNYTGMIGRWAVRLQEYDFDIVHRKTERQGNADGLTRLHRPAKSDIHPRLSYCLTTLAVPDIRPPYWDLWREDFVEISLWLVEVRLTWIEDEAHPPCIERLELLFIQAWRTNVEGELLAFLFGAVRPDHQELITQELTIPVAQLADDLPLDIISQDDEHPVPHVLSRTLTPHLQWSACVEGAAERIPPSQRQHLDPRAIRDPAFFRQPTAEQLAAIQEEEEEEESTESDDREDEREESEEGDEVLGEEDETPEEGSYSEYSEGEQSEEEEEDEEGEEGHEEESAGPEWEAVPEEALLTGIEAEDPEAARKREKIVVGKTELELAGAILPSDLKRDMEVDPGPEEDLNGDFQMVILNDQGATQGRLVEGSLRIDQDLEDHPSPPAAVQYPPQGMPPQTPHHITTANDGNLATSSHMQKHVTTNKLVRQRLKILTDEVLMRMLFQNYSPGQLNISPLHWERIRRALMFCPRVLTVLERYMIPEAVDWVIVGRELIYTISAFRNEVYNYKVHTEHTERSETSQDHNEPQGMNQDFWFEGVAWPAVLIHEIHQLPLFTDPGNCERKGASQSTAQSIISYESNHELVLPMEVNLGELIAGLPEITNDSDSESEAEAE
ncbi:hypothetical protein CBR_g6651 [Chara braunii]|uniref:Reverse transcriptase domain-containing protein n=1 Tax=Chara braunii TaxID=69332 RepID=A0A388KKE7_CHABU|nr:hypothetical protein CBR_g6651 [Chara braunii]|eukprot:GBG70524.1 hypothetical protein CBR_g6651 [Chara braunii]